MWPVLLRAGNRTPSDTAVVPTDIDPGEGSDIGKQKIQDNYGLALSKGAWWCEDLSPQLRQWSNGKSNQCSTRPELGGPKPARQIKIIVSVQ
jgi:hypothetical protein